MQVETYEVTEVNEYGEEFEQEQIALIEQLGLEGQQSLIKKDEESDTKTVNPYRLMAREEHFVYGTLFSKKVELNNYKDGIIPTRVLQIAAHAKDLGIGTLYVWCPESGRDKDPILTAQLNAWDSNNVYILARWGEALESFETLAKKAITKAKEAMIVRLKKIEKQVSNDLEILKEATNLSEMLSYRNEPTYYFSN